MHFFAANYVIIWKSLHCILQLRNNREFSCVLGWSGFWPLRGLEWVGGSLVNGLSKGRQKSYSGIWSGCRLCGFWWCILSICGIFQAC